MANRVNTAMNVMQAPGPHPSSDAIPTYSDGQQLHHGHDAMLGRGNLSDGGIAWGEFVAHRDIKSPRSRNSPPQTPRWGWGYFGGRNAAKSAPASTQLVRSSSVAAPSVSTKSMPLIGRPVKSIGRV